MPTWSDYAFGDPRGDAKALQEAQAQKLAGMRQAALVYGAYRPEAAQARMNALRNRMGAFQGTNNLMATMYGNSGSGNYGTLTQQPMGPTMLRQGMTPESGPAVNMMDNAEILRRFGPNPSRTDIYKPSDSQPEYAYGAPPPVQPGLGAYEQYMASKGNAQEMQQKADQARKGTARTVGSTSAAKKLNFGDAL